MTLTRLLATGWLAVAVAACTAKEERPAHADSAEAVAPSALSGSTSGAGTAEAAGGTGTVNGKVVAPVPPGRLPVPSGRRRVGDSIIGWDSAFGPAMSMDSAGRVKKEVRR